MCKKFKQRLKCYTFENQSLSEYNQVKLVPVLNELNLINNMSQKNKTKLRD